MPKRTLESLGILVRKRRGTRKLRETANEIGIGPATLLRIESGRIPDVLTFGKICKWLSIDPAEFLGTEIGPGRAQPRHLVASAHMKVDQNPQPETIKALAEMILLAANAQSTEQG